MSNGLVVSKQLQWLAYNDVLKYKYKMGLHNASFKLNYRGFEKLIEYQDFAKDHNNAGQIIVGKNRLLYFDIDKIKIKQEDLQDYIQSFVDLLNKELKVDCINIGDFQIHTKTKKIQDNKYTTTKYVCSIHIVSNKYYMNYFQQKDLCITLKNNKLFEELDKCVYSNGRYFIDCFNGKVGKQEKFEYNCINQHSYSFIYIDDVNKSTHIQLEYIINKDDIEAVYGDGLELILENKDKHLVGFYDWLDTLKYVKKNNLMTREDFCRASIVGMNTYEDNIMIWDNVDLHHTPTTIQELFGRITRKKLIQKQLTKHFFETINATNEMEEYFLDNEEEKIIQFGNIIYESDNGVLTIDGISQLYHYDCKIQTQKNKDEDNTIYLTRDEMKDKLDHIDDKLIGVSAMWGVGKTHNVIKPMIEKYRNLNKSMIVITENNLLNLQYSQQHQLHSHLDKNWKAYEVVSSLESMINYKNTFDLVILDEFVSLMAHFSSNTMKKPKKAYERFMELIRCCEQVVVCDADLTEHSYKHILNEIEDVPIIHHLTNNPYENCVFNYFTTKASEMKNKLFADIKINKKKVVIACNTKCAVKQLYKIMKRLTNDDTNEPLNINVMYIVSEELVINDVKQSNKKIKHIKTNLYQTMVDNNIQVLIYSPSVKSGVSFDEKYFHKFYAFITDFGEGEKDVINAREMLQMFFRIRLLIDNEYNIHINIHKLPNKSMTMKDCYDDLESDKVMYKELYHSNTTQSNDSLTLTLQTSRVEKENSKRNFSFELYSLLKKHKLNVNVVSQVQYEKIVDLSMPENELYAYWLDMEIPPLEEIYKLVERISIKKETPETHERLLLDFLYIFLKHTFIFMKNCEEQVKRMYGYFEYETLVGRKEAFTLFDYKEYKNQSSLYKSLCGERFRNYEPLPNGEYRLREIPLQNPYETNCKELNNYQAIGLLYDRIITMINENVNIHFTNEEYSWINKVRKLKNKKVYTKDNIGDAITMLNNYFEKRYGYKFNVNRKKKYEKVKVENINLNNYEPKDINERVNIRQIELHKTNDKENKYGVKLVNKYTKNPNKLEPIYGEKHKKNEYFIDPNKNTTSLAIQQTSDILHMNSMTFMPTGFREEIIDGKVICVNEVIVYKDNTNEIIGNILDDIVAKIENNNEKIVELKRIMIHIPQMTTTLRNDDTYSRKYMLNDTLNHKDKPIKLNIPRRRIKQY